ncbi:MAG: phosphoribosylamine--glycine ligase [Acidimicrobiales bacterium]
MTVCVVGSGGREHTLARVLARADDVVVTPGNPGMPAMVGGHRISVTDAPPEEVGAELTVIGPEAPLVDGLADRLRARGMTVFGPGADGARLEGSKTFMKAVLAEAGVPTARYGSFEDAGAATRFLAELPGPFVVKTDGLAAGKGVLVTDSRAEAEADVAAKLSGRAFGEAGRRVVVEEGLVGFECSIHAVCDGTRVVPLAAARDYKRAFDGDGGANTGGMGCYSPPPEVDDGLIGRVMDEAVEPTAAALRRRGIDFRGVLYGGIMVTSDGPYVLEFNVRFGDPETQVLLPRLLDDPVDLLRSAAEGRLVEAPRFRDEATVCVVAVAEGYPEAPVAGAVISGLADDGQLAAPVEGVTVVHAGTARGPGGGFVVAGGRVLGFSAMAPTLDDARRLAYRAAEQVSWEGMHLRRDIARLSEPTGVPR